MDANGLFIDINNQPTILINKNLRESKAYFTLAEEYAHYCVGVIPNVPFATDYYNKLIRSKNEHRAFVWMQRNLLPSGIEKFRQDTLMELSDELSLPLDFIYKAIEYRKDVGHG